MYKSKADLAKSVPLGNTVQIDGVTYKRVDARKNKGNPFKVILR